MVKRALCLLVLVAGLGGCARSPRHFVPARTEPGAADQVLIDIYCARIRVDAHEPSTAGALPLPGATLVRHLSKQEAAARLKRWREDPAVEIIQAPKMLTLAGQSGSIFVGEAIGDTTAGDPDFLGSLFRIAPTARGERDLRIRFHSAVKLHDPAILTEGMPKEAWAAAVTAMPYARATIAFEMPSGGYALIGSGQRMSHSEGDYWIVSLLHAVRLPRDDSTVRVEMPPVEDSIERVPAPGGVEGWR